MLFGSFCATFLIKKNGLPHRYDEYIHFPLGCDRGKLKWNESHPDKLVAVA
jgi:hypothetical protein